MKSSAFSRFMRKAREDRRWTLADLARSSGLSQSEVSRIESGSRLPTMRHVKGLAEAFSSSPKVGNNELIRYETWVAHLVDLGERARIDARSGPGRWSKR
jgi:transcriptional regulator with XRE-family HTH domain